MSSSGDFVATLPVEVFGVNLVTFFGVPLAGELNLGAELLLGVGDGAR